MRGGSGFVTGRPRLRFGSVLGIERTPKKLETQGTIRVYYECIRACVVKYIIPFYNRFRGYLRLAGLPPSGVHVLRHTAAKLRRDVGESVESVSQFLDHSSLAVTTTYLRRLEGERDTAWHGVASVLGLS